MRGQLRQFLRLSGYRRALLVEAAACLLIARVSVRIIRFPRIARRLGTFVSPTDARADAKSTTSHSDHLVAREIRWAVSRAVRRVPFRAVCLPQALAARSMLRRRGIPCAVHFGGALATDSSSLDSHAWLEAAGVEVTGYPIPNGIAEIGRFVDRKARVTQNVTRPESRRLDAVADAVRGGTYEGPIVPESTTEGYFSVRSISDAITRGGVQGRRSLGG